jgi:hypothetical protein
MGYNREQEVFSMVVQNKKGIAWKMTFIGVLVLWLSLVGCGNVDLGEAQIVFERGMRTYDIVPNTFLLQSDTDPTIEVTGDATKYTLVDSGRVLFTANDTTGDRNINLDSGDVIIERPMANSITVITQRTRIL